STDEKSRTAGRMPAVTTNDHGVAGSSGEPARTAGYMPSFTRTGPAVPPTSSVSSTTAVTHTRPTNPDVTPIQKLLAGKGFYKSKMDGQLGPGTQEAMRGYQSAEGLEANGFPTLATLEKLGVNPENPSIAGDAEPAGTGGVVYSETVDHKYTTETSG